MQFADRTRLNQNIDYESNYSCYAFFSSFSKLFFNSKYKWDYLFRTNEFFIQLYSLEFI